MRTKDGVISYEDRINFLKIFSQFDENEQNPNVIFEYRIEDEKFDVLKRKYDYIKCIDVSSEFRSMVALMIWVNNHLNGDGMCIPPSTFNADYVLDNTNTRGLYSNCYMYATVLNELFLSVGFKSRMIRCMPVDLDYNDCHCVTEAYSYEFNKWIVFDAANRAYYINNKMIPLNLFELREHIIAQKRVLVPMMGRVDSLKLIQYFAKNLIRFETFKESCYGNECEIVNKTLIHFQSSNYPISDKIVYYPEWGIYVNHIHTSNPHIFWAKPIT